MLKSLCVDKPYCSFEKLPHGEHLIYGFALVKTKIDKENPRLRVDLGDKVVFLPERFSTYLTAEGVADLNVGQKVLIYNGKDVTNHNKLKIDFRAVDDFTADLSDSQFAENLI